MCHLFTQVNIICFASDLGKQKLSDVMYMKIKCKSTIPKKKITLEINILNNLHKTETEDTYNKLTILNKFKQ